MPRRIVFVSFRLTPAKDHYGTPREYLPMRLLTFNSVRLKNWHLTRIRSPFWRLYCNLDAGAEIRFGRTRMPMEARAVYLVPAWLTWDGDSKPGVRHVYAHFDLPGMAGALTQRAFPRPMKVHPPSKARRARGPNLGSEMERLAKAFAHAEVADPLLVCWAKSLVYRGLQLAFAQVPRAVREQCLHPAIGVPALDALLNYVEEHLHEDLGMDPLAERLHCSRAQVTRLFRKHLGVSPGVYVAERRIAHASELLVHGEASIEQVAERCGFPNRYYFTRIFSRLLGVPPAKYRKLSARR